MDRRRFSPSAEGLEGRALLSLLGAGNYTKYNTTISIEDLPKTYKEKELRIAHLPYYLLQEDPSRFLPGEVTSQLQTDINNVVSELHAPTGPVVDAFNAGLRKLMPQNNLSPQDAQYLSRSFGLVLEKAGATVQEVTALQNDMNQLALVDSHSIQPSTLARGDYSLVLQTTLAVGRPMITPTSPSLHAKDGVKTDGGRLGLTTDHTPTMVGSYPAGASKDGEVWIQIVDQKTGAVYGTMPVSAAGTYTIKLSNLPDGTYYLTARSSDEVGHLSLESNPFILRIKTPVARGQAAVNAQAQVMVGVPPTTTSTTPPGGPLGLTP